MDLGATLNRADQQQHERFRLARTGPTGNQMMTAQQGDGGRVPEGVTADANRHVRRRRKGRHCRVDTVAQRVTIADRHRHLSGPLVRFHGQLGGSETEPGGHRPQLPVNVALGGLDEQAIDESQVLAFGHLHDPQMAV
jgi:hypothetical protein